MNWKATGWSCFGVAVLSLGALASAASASPLALDPTWSVNAYNNPAPNGVHVTLSGESATGFTYEGTGTGGLPGTTLPDSRRRPKVYQNFDAFNAGGVGSTLTMTYDIQWGGAVDPVNSSQNWRFGFTSSTANGGKGLSLGANFDLGDLAGTAAYEFFVDTSLTSGEAGSGTMDTAFTETLNGVGDGIARIAQSNADPFSDDVAFNDRDKVLRVTMTLERIADGYDLGFTWTNLDSGNTITHAATITTADFDPSVALAAGVTSWDGLGFFINADSLGSPAGPWVYTMSNVGVDGTAVPEPSAALLALCGLAATACCRRKNSGSTPR